MSDCRWMCLILGSCCSEFRNYILCQGTLSFISPVHWQINFIWWNLHVADCSRRQSKTAPRICSKWNGKHVCFLGSWLFLVHSNAPPLKTGSAFHSCRVSPSDADSTASDQSSGRETGEETTRPQNAVNEAKPHRGGKTGMPPPLSHYRALLHALYRRIVFGSLSIFIFSHWKVMGGGILIWKSTQEDKELYTPSPALRLQSRKLTWTF